MFEIARRSANADTASATLTSVQRPRQTKLKVSQPGDVLEREADRLADHALRGSEPGDDLHTRNEAQVRLSRDTSGTAEDSRELPPDVRDVVRSPGEPLDTATRGFMGTRFGVDFSRVRIHSDERAVASAYSLNARAYTVGSHVVFGAGEYAPSAETGKRLLAHEMAHVVQQNEGGGLAIQRREGKYPGPTASATHGGEKGSPSPRDARNYPTYYTILKPKKLNAKGPFSAAILDSISSAYFDAPGTRISKTESTPALHGARKAELILTLLESSAEFVDMAAKLDAFYADDKNPGFEMFGGFTGSKFIRAGTPFQISRTEQATTVSSDVLMIDPTGNPLMSGADPSLTDEQVAVAFVDALVHETVHAFRRVSTLTKPGLKGSIEEELETRKKSGAILTDIASGSSKKIQQEAAGYIKGIQANTQSMKQVGLSIASDGLTYVEGFFVDAAFREFFKGYANSKPDLIPGLNKLDHPSTVSPGAAADQAQKLRELIEPRDVIVDRDTSLREEMQGVQPRPTVKTIPPRILGVSELVRVLDLIDRTASLKDLTKEAKDTAKLSPAGLAVFFHVLLLKTSLIKETLKQEHEDGPDVTDKTYEAFCNGLATTFLGENKPYDQLK
ncbi:MAG TPA: DUF4157 domain-containing protein [Vicinamibacterales bacterium]|jgi:hypothetical protein